MKGAIKPPVNYTGLLTASARIAVAETVAPLVTPDETIDSLTYLLLPT